MALPCPKGHAWKSEALKTWHGFMEAVEALKERRQSRLAHMGPTQLG